MTDPSYVGKMVDARGEVIGNFDKYKSKKITQDWLANGFGKRLEKGLEKAFRNKTVRGGVDRGIQVASAERHLVRLLGWK